MATRSARQTALLAGGDVAINRPRARGAFGPLTPLFQKAGVALVNLELPLSRGGRAQPEKILLRGAPEMAGALTEARFDALALANNHMLDYGEEALLDTLALLEESGLPSAGAGPHLAAARRAAAIERGGLKIGLLAFSSIIPRGFSAGPGKPGINPLRAHTAYETWRDVNEYPGTLPKVATWADEKDLGRMKRDIRALKRRADAVIVNHHWGTSMTHKTQDFQTELARASIDAGADLVLGGHPHVLQGVEFYKDTPIVYSMGNLIFDFHIPHFTASSKQTFLFGCTLTKKGVRDPHLIPCWSGDFEKPTLLSPRHGRGKAIAAFMRDLSEPLGTQLEIRGDRVALMPGEVTGSSRDGTAAYFGKK
jgi:poly-gamma-glutamate synthesis protein (capsule biosynthesis protein)